MRSTILLDDHAVVSGYALMDREFEVKAPYDVDIDDVVEIVNREYPVPHVVNVLAAFTEVTVSLVMAG